LQVIHCFLKAVINFNASHHQRGHPPNGSDERQHVSDDEDQHHPREGLHEEGVDGADEVGAEREVEGGG